MTVTMSVVSACLIGLAVLVVWPSSVIQRGLLLLLSLGLRAVLAIAIVVLAGVAVVPDGLLERLLNEEAQHTLLSLEQHTGGDFRLACVAAAVAVAVAGLPWLIGLDFARGMAGHAAWLKRLHERVPAGSPQAAAASPARPAAQQRRSLDELLN